MSDTLNHSERPNWMHGVVFDYEAFKGQITAIDYKQYEAQAKEAANRSWL